MNVNNSSASNSSSLDDAIDDATKDLAAIVAEIEESYQPTEAKIADYCDDFDALQDRWRSTTAKLAKQHNDDDVNAVVISDKLHTTESDTDLTDATVKLNFEAKSAAAKSAEDFFNYAGLENEFKELLCDQSNFDETLKTFDDDTPKMLESLMPQPSQFLLRADEQSPLVSCLAKKRDKDTEQFEPKRVTFDLNNLTVNAQKAVEREFRRLYMDNQYMATVNETAQLPTADDWQRPSLQIEEIFDDDKECGEKELPQDQTKQPPTVSSRPKERTFNLIELKKSYKDLKSATAAAVDGKYVRKLQQCKSPLNLMLDTEMEAVHKPKPKERIAIKTKKPSAMPQQNKAAQIEQLEQERRELSQAKFRDWLNGKKKATTSSVASSSMPTTLVGGPKAVKSQEQAKQQNYRTYPDNLQDVKVIGHSTVNAQQCDVEGQQRANRTPNAWQNYLGEPKEVPKRFQVKSKIWK